MVHCKAYYFILYCFVLRLPIPLLNLAWYIVCTWVYPLIIIIYSSLACSCTWGPEESSGWGGSSPWCWDWEWLPNCVHGSHGEYNGTIIILTHWPLLHYIWPSFYIAVIIIIVYYYSYTNSLNYWRYALYVSLRYELVLSMILKTKM